MSKKKLKKIGLIALALLAVISIVVYVLFFADFGVKNDDIETIKANGGFELLKSDVTEITKCKDSQALKVADTFFETIGIESYEYMEAKGKKGNFTVVADGYNFDCSIVGGSLKLAYIGNVSVYANTKENAQPLATSLSYTYPQYKNMVTAFTKGLGVEAQDGKDMFEKLTNVGFSNFTEIDSGKLKELGLTGYFGYEGNLRLFMVLNATKNDFDKIYITCDAFEPIEVYNSVGEAPYKINDVKITMGTRQGIANVMAYKVQQATGVNATFPTALTTGDDSWLMVKKDNEIYLEVNAEVTDSKGNKSSKPFCLLIDSGSNEPTWIKMDKKVILGG